MTKFSENIKYLRNKKGLSQEALAEELDLNRGKISAYEESRAKPNFETLISISEYFKLPIDALIKTDLTLCKDGAYIDIGSNRLLFPVIINEDNEDLIEIIPKKASAGYLQGYTDTEYFANMPIMNLGFLPTGKYRAFPIEGDSMHPWVKDGDYVVGEYVESVSEIKDGDCYVVLTQRDGLVYKRLFTDKVDSGVLTFSSDNKLYQPYELHLSEVLEIWKYTLNLSIGQYTEEQLNPESIMNMLRNLDIDLKSMRTEVNVIKDNVA